MGNEKILLVIGASSNVGSALIRRVHKNYTKIIAHYNNNISGIELLRDELGDIIIPVHAEFDDTTSVDSMIDFIKDNGYFPEHIVHLVSPKCRNERFHKINTEELEMNFRCSVSSFARITAPIINNMSKNKRGKIAVMLTAYTENIPPKFLSSYISVKYALLGMVKSMAVEYAGKGICINAVSPDMMDTNFISEIPRIAVEQTAEQNVMGRLLSVDEVIPTFEYLLSEASDRVTGQNILITGVK